MNEHEKLSKRLNHPNITKVVLGYYQAQRLLQEYKALVHQLDELETNTPDTALHEDLSHKDDYIDGGAFNED